MKLIDKDALVAEIEKLSDIICQGVFADESKLGIEYYKERLLSFLDTLEVKEVDMEKEINKYICNNFFGSQTLGFFASRTKEEPNDVDMALCAKYFFELGLKAQKGE